MNRAVFAVDSRFCQHFIRPNLRVNVNSGDLRGGGDGSRLPIGTCSSREIRGDTLLGYSCM